MIDQNSTLINRYKEEIDFYSSHINAEILIVSENKSNINVAAFLNSIKYHQKSLFECMKKIEDLRTLQ